MCCHTSLGEKVILNFIRFGLVVMMTIALMMFQNVPDDHSYLKNVGHSIKAHVLWLSSSYYKLDGSLFILFLKILVSNRI